MPRQGPRPGAWRSGPDPKDHAQYRTWIQARNQAQFRREPWDITFAQFQELWAEHWAHKGRERSDYCMTRTDVEGSWTWGNVEVIPRQEHFCRAGKRRNEIRWGKI